MADWGAFAGFSGVVVLLFLALARASAAALTGDDSPPNTQPAADGALAEPDESPPVDDAGARPGPEPGPTVAPAPASPEELGTGALLANVLATHGLFGGLVAAGAVFWEVPLSALGIGPPTPGHLAAGLAAGLALYVADEVGAAVTERLGVAHEETLRELLAPDSAGGWVLLLAGVLPVVAVAEELVFRGAMIGGLAAGFGWPVWALVAGSSVLFALGHGAQGIGGVVVTGLLGLALGALFAATGSFLVVVVAHYLVNALELLVHEGFGVEWAGG